MTFQGLTGVAIPLAKLDHILNSKSQSIKKALKTGISS